jgi:hypothetical protein
MLHNFVCQRDGYNFHDSLHVRGFEDIANTDMEKLGKGWRTRVAAFARDKRWSNAATSSETRPLP